MSNLRWGVSGLGRGRLFVEKLNALADCEVVAVCDPNERALAGFDGLAGYTGYEAFISQSKLDAVALIGPGPTHAPQALAALEAGIHVVSETPCVYSLEEAEAVVGAVQRSGCKYMLAEDYIFMGWVERLRELAEAGELGEIVAGHGEYTHDCRGMFLLSPEGGYLPWAERDAHPDAPPSWRATDLPPLKYCSHTVGPLLHVMQDRCVKASGLHTGSRTFPEAGVIDLESAVLQTERGAVITLTNGFGVAHPFAFFIALIGTKGSVRCISFGSPEVKVYTDTEGGGWRALETGWSERPDGRDWLIVMLEEFVGSIREDTTPPIDVVTSMEFTVPGICAHMSAEQGGGVIEVPDYGNGRAR